MPQIKMCMFEKCLTFERKNNNKYSKKQNKINNPIRVGVAIN